MPLTGRLPGSAAKQAQADVMLGMITGHWVAQTIRAGAELSVADHVAAGARTAPEVAALELSDPGATYRLMRAMASLGLLSYEGDGKFSVTRLGELLQEGEPGSLRSAALARSGPGIWEPLGLLPQAVRRGRADPDTDLFGYFGANEAAAVDFSRAMSDLTRQLAEDTVALLDPGDARTVVDIGGANGTLVLALLGAHPRLSGHVLDLPHVVGGAQAAAERAGLADRFTAVAGDFFDSVPAADYYLLKWILHDWPDDNCVRILRNCRAAGGAGARLLIVEALLGKVGEPDPVALFDMNMLAVTSGRQRGLAEIDALAAASGWRRTGLSRTRTIDSLLELEAV